MIDARLSSPLRKRCLGAGGIHNRREADQPRRPLKPMQGCSAGWNLRTGASIRFLAKLDEVAIAGLSKQAGPFFVGYQ